MKSTGPARSLSSRDPARRCSNAARRETFPLPFRLPGCGRSPRRHRGYGSPAAGRLRGRRRYARENRVPAPRASHAGRSSPAPLRPEPRPSDASSVQSISPREYRLPHRHGADGCRPSNKRLENVPRSRATPSRCFTRVEIVTIRPIPAASARATMASRSAAKSGKSRWQWLSTSICLTPPTARRNAERPPPARAIWCPA